jgi:hypothetical protein
MFGDSVVLLLNVSTKGEREALVSGGVVRALVRAVAHRRGNEFSLNFISDHAWPSCHPRSQLRHQPKACVCVIPW